MLFIIITTFISIYAFFQTLEGQTPIDIIFDAFLQKKYKQKKTVLSLFSNELLINKRLESLLSNNLILINNDTYSLSNRGRTIWYIFNRLRNMLGLSIGG